MNTSCETAEPDILPLVPTSAPFPVVAPVAQRSSDQTTASVPSDHEEVEWQFDAVDLRPVERWVDQRVAKPADEAGSGIEPARGGIHLVPQSTRRLTDRYLDTDDWRLFRAGFTLRVRESKKQTEATLKSMAPAQLGIRQRRELTQPVEGRNVEALLDSEGPVSGRVRLIAGKHSVSPLFEVKTLRRSFSLQLSGEPVGEIAIDRTTIPVLDGGEPVRLKRVEVEVDEPEAPAVASFVEELRNSGGLHPATVSKFEAGLMALGGPPIPARGLEPAAIQDSLTVGEVAFAVLGAQFQALLAKEGGTRLGEDPEELHDMRVATRRLRAAMSLFAEALPVRAALLRAELTWAGNALGAVRDLDVQIETVREWANESDEPDRGSLHDLEAVLAGRREEARTQLLVVLDSRRYERLLAAMTGMLERGPLRRSPTGRTPVVAAAPDLIQGHYRRVRKAGNRIDKSSGSAEYHRLRIRCKRLRYALEFLSPVYGRPAERLAKQLVRLQDLLGLHQDAQVAMAWLRELALDSSPPLSLGSVFVMGRIAERYAEQARRARARFPGAYSKLRGKRWREVARLMKERRPSITSTAPAYH
jgi:CHAD domain-containing protein